MQHSPDYTATLGPRVSTGMTSTGEYALSSNLYYTSKIFMSPSGTQFLQPAYFTLAVRAQWTDPSKKYFAALYGDNVTNDRYRNPGPVQRLRHRRRVERPRDLGC